MIFKSWLSEGMNLAVAKSAAHLSVLMHLQCSKGMLVNSTPCRHEGMPFNPPSRTPTGEALCYYGFVLLFKLDLVTTASLSHSHQKLCKSI